MAPIDLDPDGDPTLEVYTTSGAVDKLGDFAALSPAQKTDAIVRAQDEVDGVLAGIFPALSPPARPALWTNTTTPGAIEAVTARLAAADLLETTRAVQRSVPQTTGPAIAKSEIFRTEGRERLGRIKAGTEDLYDPVTKIRLARLTEWEQITLVEPAAPVARHDMAVTSAIDLSGWTVLLVVTQSGTLHKGEVYLGGRTNIGTDNEALYVQGMSEYRAAEKRWRGIDSLDSSKLLGGDAGSGVLVALYAKRMRGVGYGGRRG